VGLENPVSQLKAVPRPDTGSGKSRAEEKFAGEPKFSVQSAARDDAAAPVVAPMDDRQLAQWELMTDQLLSGSAARPWHVRHARKLIGSASIIAAAGLAFFSYDAWRLHKEPAAAAAPLPAKAFPETLSVPAAVAPQVEAPPKPAAAPSARASLPARSAAPPAAVNAGPAVQPAEVTPRATISRSIQNVAPIPAVAPAAPRSTGTRVPPVTHTLPEEPAPEAAPAVAATASAVATVPVATPPVAAPDDCPDAILALGLCASHARKGTK
jgi:hypothetical protein